MSPTVLRLTAASPVAQPLSAAALKVAPPAAPAAIRQAMRDALAEPVEFPELRYALTPDDQVAIALEGATPGAEPIAETLAEQLIALGVAGANIVIVTDDRHLADRLRPLEERLSLVVETHDPTDEEQLCFAGLTRSERTLRVNRTLFEADLVLPISTEHPGDRATTGPFDGLFPRFFDHDTIDRVARVRAVTGAEARGGDHAQARRQESDDAGRMLGAAVLVRVVPGRGGAAERIVFGEANAVWSEARRLAQSVWRSSMPAPAPLVIARFEDDATPPTWGDLSRALALAEQLVASDGAIVLWTDFDEPIGPGLGRLLEADGYERVTADLSEQVGDEALFAWRLAQAIDRGPVFWRSRLAGTLVEDLGATPIASEEELVRLAERYGTCLLLEQPQHVCLVLDEDAEASS
ncbi:hypothetical protein [Botrimarina hoheduenensis]|uniref:LarA-like N-terminal domain-containing protein n=1 Tax=Botrimarina hoheduenensis TaxID=2528000 RepID=A0A5C5WBI6_9BACT|nr:hypothetical protein [Botrimarina hoheduenensis]TWT47475.1 hypothetical protein Pla111_10890 [Botrimarina hoheduenensis]